MRAVVMVALCLGALSFVACGDDGPASAPNIEATVEVAVRGTLEAERADGEAAPITTTPPQVPQRSGAGTTVVRTLTPTAAAAAPHSLPTPTPLATSLPRPTPTPTYTPTPDPTKTLTPTPTLRPTKTPTPTPTYTPTLDPTKTPTPSLTPTATPAPPGVQTHPSAKRFIRQLADIDLDLAKRAAEFAWVADGLSGKEWHSLVSARDLAKHDVETAKILFDDPYMAVDATQLKFQTTNSLFQIARANPELARWLVSQPFMEPPFRDRDSFAMEAMTLIAVERPERSVLSLLEEQPWFSDGIDDDEAALLTVMRSLVYIDADYRRALIDTHRVVSKSIVLPLAGDTELIVVSHKQEVDYDETFAAMERGARSQELFLQLAFPVTDIILLLADISIWNDPGSGNYLGSGTSPYFKLDFPFRNRSVYHELGHFYFYGGINRWIREGGADFLATEAEVSVGATTVETRMDYVEEYIRRNCDETIQESLVDWRRSYCDYSLGERLYWNLYTGLGEETASEGMRALALAFPEGQVYEEEEDFYEIFLEQVSPDLRDDFNRVYAMYHGGPIPE